MPAAFGFEKNIYNKTKTKIRNLSNRQRKTIYGTGTYSFRLIKD